MTLVIALTCQASGVGKDTLAAMLCSDYGYIRLSYGDFLRADLAASFDTKADERAAMLRHGIQVALREPLRYACAMRRELMQLPPTAHVVITDLRKPAELAMLRLTPGLELFVVEVTSSCRGTTHRLDGLLEADCTIHNDNAPEHMLLELARQLELLEPYFT